MTEVKRETSFWPVADLRSFLLGRWRIDRSLLDRRHSIAGQLLGEAVFTRNGRSLRYHEHGTVTFGAHHGSAEQTYHFEFSDDDGRACVYFDDGRAFHELDLPQGCALVSHVCNPDLYEGRFIALDARRWQSVWEVVGPRKDQSIVTLYTRIC
jgi:hypothetical protein